MVSEWRSYFFAYEGAFQLQTVPVKNEEDVPSLEPVGGAILFGDDDLALEQLDELVGREDAISLSNGVLSHSPTNMSWEGIHEDPRRRRDRLRTRTYSGEGCM